MYLYVHVLAWLEAPPSVTISGFSLLTSSLFTPPSVNGLVDDLRV